MRAFRERVDGNDLAQTKIGYRVAGGMRNEPGLPPLPPPDEVLTVEGEGTARVRSGDLIVGEARLDKEVVASLFERVRASMPVLVPRSEARFLPDSVIGEITIDVAGEQQQLYFLIDDETEQPPGEPGLTGMRLALRDVVDKVLPDQTRGH